jgi:hypothetical protein
LRGLPKNDGYGAAQVKVFAIESMRFAALLRGSERNVAAKVDTKTEFEARGVKLGAKIRCRKGAEFVVASSTSAGEGALKFQSLTRIGS